MINLGACVIAARKARGLKQFELARRAEMGPAQLCQIENGRVSPSFHVVERLAAALDMDIAGLLSGECKQPQSKPAAPKEPVIADDSCYVPVRAFEPQAGRVLKQILDEERERNALEDARGVGSACTVAFNRVRAKDGGAGAALAEELRADLGLGTAPVGNLIATLEFRGLHVTQTKLPKTVGSVSFWNRERHVPVIVLNDTATPERQLYRLVYELGSLSLFASQGYHPLDESLDQHRFLTDFTASFLMPGVAVRTAVTATGIGPSEWTLAAVVALKSLFGVSAESFALRLEELGLIAPALRLAFRDELRAYYVAHPKAMEPHAKDRSLKAILAGIKKGC